MTITLNPLIESRRDPLPEMSSPVPVLSTEQTLHLDVRDDGICVLTFDRPGSSANIFDLHVLDELSAELDFVSRETKLQGLIFISAKPTIFIAGADLNMLRPEAPAADARLLIERGQSIMNRIASLPIPTVAAIHGATMGGGFELSLACDYRIATHGPHTRIGLPETKIGLLPGWGGATRLPRLIGLPRALDIILGGKTVSAAQALKLGMVDEVIHAEHLITAAVRKIHAGKRSRPNLWLTNNPLSAYLIAYRASREVQRKTRGNYPATIKALEVMVHGINRTVEQSLALERDGLVELAQNPACHNLLRLFFQQERAKKRSLSIASLGAEHKPLMRTAVIGAGVMGAGIAQWLSSRQRSVILRDINVDALQKGMATIHNLYRDGLKRHLFSRLEMRDGMDRIYPAPAEVPMQQVDIVIEAAVENLGLKKQIFQNLDRVAGRETILATNTSALPISEIAAATAHPERVVGLHFFNPVHRMQLVEVITTPRTAPDVLQRTLRFAQQIGKLPVVVRDSPGFIVNRILMPYLIEAGNLFEAGARPADIDNVMLDFGMPMGPLRLLDEIGLDVALHVAETLAPVLPSGMNLPECLRQMTMQGLLGRKNGRGFYLYEKSGERPNSHNQALVLSDKARALPREELAERLTFLMANEAARCLEEGIVNDPADVDFAMVMGTGYAPFRGGPLRHLDAIGLDRARGAMEVLVTGGATYFTPCKLLTELAAEGKKFYPL